MIKCLVNECNANVNGEFISLIETIFSPCVCTYLHACMRQYMHVCVCT